MKVTVLAAMGRHPASGRPRVADVEARAFALAWQQNGAAITVLHAGPQSVALPPLRDFLGMGAANLQIADIAPECDALPALVQAIEADMPDIILAGTRAETGECGGALPFFLAERLRLPIVTSAVAIAIEGPQAVVTQALPGGKRRRLMVALPFLATVDRSGPSPRFAAFAKARRGEVGCRAGIAELDARTAWPVRPAPPRPTRLLAPGPADRLGAILGTGAAVSGRQTLSNIAPAEAAAAILDFLVREGLAPAAAATSTQPE